MAKETLLNPFVVGKYIGAEYFCDRDEEVRALRKHADNGRNVALISQRRLGKSGLICHFFAQAETSQSYNTVLFDIYATSSLTEFVYLFGKSVFEQLGGKRKSFIDKFFSVIRSLRLGFRIDSETGDPSFDVSLGDIHTPETTLDEIFAYMEQSEKPCIVALDEFQQISEYPEQNVEALLRTRIQRCTRTRFIFAGSRESMMARMFLSPDKPFYQSVITMPLYAIPVDIYTRFAQSLFTSCDRSLDEEVARRVHSELHGVTWYMQMIMNELFALTPEYGTCTADMIPIAFDNIVMSQEFTYRDLLRLLPLKQKALLQAVAKADNPKSLTSAAFVKTYNLSSASSVQAAAKGLTEKVLLKRDNAGYYIPDFFLAQWLRTQY